MGGLLASAGHVVQRGGNRPRVSCHQHLREAQILSARNSTVDLIMQSKNSELLTLCLRGLVPDPGKPWVMMDSNHQPIA